MIRRVLESRATGSGGPFYDRCSAFLQERFGFPFVGMTYNCTSALELSAQLLELGPGDEVILPSYAYVTTANAFARFGVELKFADSLPDHPNIDPKEIERLISPKTKAIVVLHYGGSCCDMDAIMGLAENHKIPVVEDAAHALGVKWKNKYAGSYGDFGAISFHETKNIQCGEGGALIVNRPEWIEKVQTFLEHGTNRKAFERGEVERYEWTGLGSALKPSELSAAMLYAQLPEVKKVAQKRIEICRRYRKELRSLAAGEKIQFLKEDEHVTYNGHIFALLLPNAKERKALSDYLHEKGISAYLHFGALHASPYYRNKYTGPDLVNALKFEVGLLRLPVYPSLTEEEQCFLIEQIKDLLNL